MTDLIDLCRKQNTTISEVLDCILKNKDTKDDINAKNNDGDTALMSVCCHDKLEIVKLLVALGADINVKDNYGNTALMLACSHDKLEIIKLLVALGADVNAKDNDGDTALMRAFHWGNLKIVAYLESLNKDTFLMYEGKKYKLVEES